jgi:hypothetical protein
VFLGIITIICILSIASVFAAEEHLLPLQGTAKLNGATLASGNIIVEIYDAPTGGNLIYNSSTDFNNVISGGKYDIILGNGTQPLSLNFGQKYYMDMYIQGVDMDFNGSERQVFMSTVGNLSSSNPVKITSNDADDALNVSAGGSYFKGNVSVNGTVVLSESGNVTITKQLKVQSGDWDDTINVTGGIYVLGQIKTNSDIIGTNSAKIMDLWNTVILRNTDADDALNVSAGGSYFKGAVVIANNSSEAALNLTAGGLFVEKDIITDGNLNVTGDESVRGIFTVMSSLNANSEIIVSGKLRANGQIEAYTGDIDDTLNVTGGSFFLGNVSVNNSIILSQSGNITSSGEARITSTEDGALNLTAGGASIYSGLIVGNGAFIINGAGQVATDTTFTQGIAGTNAGKLIDWAGDAEINRNLTVQNQVIINSSENDDALNVTGTAFLGGLIVGSTLIGTNANKALTWPGQAIFTSTDADDALNVSAGGVNIYSGISVGNNGFRTDGNGQITSDVNFTQGIVGTNGGKMLDWAGKVKVLSINPDALNVTGGIVVTAGTLNVTNQGAHIGNNADYINVNTGPGTNTVFSVVDLFNVSGTSNNADLFTAGRIVTYSQELEAVNISRGGLYVNDQSLFNNVATFRNKVQISFGNDFALNVSGGAHIEQNLIVKNQVIINSTDNDDALNVTGTAFLGGLILGSSLTGTNANKALTWPGQAIFTSTDADDALNITVGSQTIFEGNMSIGNANSVNQHHLDIYGGGTNKCSYLTLYDEDRIAYYLFVNGTGGNLLIGTSIPDTCDEFDGNVVGKQT